MPYQPYTPTWQNPYLPQYNQGQPVQPMMQPYQQPTQQKVLVDGPTEAMNRFLMRYPANQLVPGFISDELFDVNGRQFHVLSVETDGRRNLETFDYKLHVEQQPVQIDGAQFVSKQEYDQFVAKVSAALEAINGVHAAVSATGTADAAQCQDGAAPLDNARGPIGANL
jgi:hypothetical protein